MKDLLSANPKAERARRKLLKFVQYVKEDYSANWHHELLCTYLDKFVSGEIMRLMVFMPPQHGKSELVSRNLPAFILGKNPKTKIVLASYSSDLSSSFNRDCQRIIDSKPYYDLFPKTKLNQSNIVTVAKGSWLRNSEIFETVGEGGFLKTTGVGGSLTGTPADVAIIDDPVKDSIEAMSGTYQYRNWNWYTDVLHTRIHNGTRILITQTRWDVNDLSGKLLQQMTDGHGDKWMILCLPAIKENNDCDYDPRAVGEALWPERHSKEKLLMVRAQSIRTYESLYQQNPKPTQSGGEFYKQFNSGNNTDMFKYNKDLPLHLTFDFNVNPYMTGCAWQIITVDKKNEVEYKRWVAFLNSHGFTVTTDIIKIGFQIDEITLASPRNTTRAVCREFKSRFPGHTSGLFIYGDPSGSKEDTRSEKGFNDYTIIRQELEQYRPQLRVDKKHPAVVMRGNFINNVFESGYEGLFLFINVGCKKSVDDYLYLKEDSDGTKLKEKGKDTATGITFEKYGHTSDANDYFICYAFSSEFTSYQRGGITLNVTIGKNNNKKTY